jgi:hypothetical protein
MSSSSKNQAELISWMSPLLESLSLWARIGLGTGLGFFGFPALKESRPITSLGRSGNFHAGKSLPPPWFGSGRHVVVM